MRGSCDSGRNTRVTGNLSAMIYPVHEIFVSVQGEGHNVGVPMVFVRLLGCNLSCPYCDTSQPKITEERMMSSADIGTRIRELTKHLPVRWACITGGEPTIHNLAPLMAAIRFVAKKVALETNGTRELKREESPDWLAVSPKWPPGLPGLKQRGGHEVKIPIYSQVSDDEVREALFQGGIFRNRFLQPVDDKDWGENVQRSVRLSIETGARISGQLHKRLGIA